MGVFKEKWDKETQISEKNKTKIEKKLIALNLKSVILFFRLYKFLIAHIYFCSLLKWGKYDRL